MNERLRNNAILNLAKCVHATIMAMVMLGMFFVAAISNHPSLAFIIFVLFSIIVSTITIQLMFFVRNMRLANKI